MTKSMMWCALVGAFAANTSALAADPAVAVKDGIMQFPNVVVINKPMQATEVASTQVGFKAYKDENGALRGPTPEESLAESRAASNAAPQARRFSAARSFTKADGTTMMAVDDSLVMYSVMVRQADGSLTEVCVPGEEAQSIVNGKVDVQAAAKEQPNDR